MPAPRKRPDTVRRRTASDQVSAALLHAAEAVLDRDGTAGVTIRSVAGEAGVAPMSVYNRFDNKEGLLAALAVRALDELATAITRPSDDDPIERLRRACRRYRDYALEHNARYLLIFTVGTPLGDQSSAAATHGRSVFAVLVELVRAVSVGESPTGVTELAEAVWSAVHGAVTIEIAGIGQTPDPASSFDHMLDLLIAGLAHPSGL